MSEKTTPVLLSALIAVHILIGTLFSITMPPFEKLDERSHWYYVHHMRRTWSLPDQRTIRPTRLQWYQPPLYYFVAAVLTSPIPSTDYLEPPINDFYLPFPLTHIPDNANLWLHDPKVESWPWRGDILAIYLTRGLSLACLTVASLFAFRLARLLFNDDWLALGVTAWLALKPGTLNYATTVANDPLSGLTGTALLLVASYGLLRGFTWRSSALLGVLAGLTLLSKVTTAATVLAIPVAYWLSPGWKNNRRQLVAQFALTVGVAFAVSGWWFIRNWIMYGELTGSYYGAQQYGIISSAVPTWQDIKNQLFVWFFRYWAHFGAVGLPYLGNVALVILAGWLVLGLILFFARRQLTLVTEHKRLFIFLGVVLLMNFVELPLLSLGQSHGSQPRWIFSAYAIAAIAEHLGVIGWLGAKRSRLAALVPLLILLPLALYSTVGVLWPAYRRPLFVRDAALLSSRYDTSADIPIGDTIRLVGFDLEPEVVKPGQVFWVTLCFESRGPTVQPYPYFVHVIDPATDVKVGVRHSHPGLGSYPTSYWEPGVAFCDRIRVPIDRDLTAAEAPRTYTVITGFFDKEIQEPLLADVAGKRDPFIALGTMAVIPERWPDRLPDPPLATFGGLFQLSQARLSTQSLTAGQTLTLDLTWQALTETTTDYTVFVHLLAGDNTLVTQYDGQPRNGLFPTSFWPAEAVVAESIRLLIPTDTQPGQYRIVGGWYNLSTGERLPVIGPDGQPLPNGFVELGTLAVHK